MTKTENLRKEIADLLADWFGHPLGYYNEFFYDKADQVLSHPCLDPYLWDIEEVEVPRILVDSTMTHVESVRQAKVIILEAVGGKLVKATKLEVK